MEQKQLRKRSMYYVVENYLNTVPVAVLNSMPNFNVLSTDFTNKVAELRVISEDQNLNRRGNGITKSDAKIVMVTKTVATANRVKAYAQSIGDQILFEKVNVQPSVLFRKADSVSVDISTIVYNEAKNNLANLSTYGVTETTLDELRNSISAFFSSIPLPKRGINDRKDATQHMEILFKSIDGILKEMDILSDMLRYSNEDFYAKYYINRRMVKPSYRHISIQGIISDEFNSPIEKALIRIKKQMVQRLTSSKGGFELKNLESGVYELEVSKPGYVTQIIEVAVTAGLKTELNLTLLNENSLLKVA